MIDVSIIFVNYNTTKLLKECLESVKKQIIGVNYEVVIVDNDSNTENKEGLKELSSEYKVVLSDENLGFGRANNLGATYASGKYLFLLNTDTVLVNNAIKILFDYIESDPECGVVGVNMFDKDHKPYHSYLRFLPSIKAMIKDEILPSKYSYYRNLDNYNFNKTDSPLEVGYITGAAFMISKKIFDELGGFDKDFFLYCEETELCARVKKSGYKIINVPQAEIIHYEGASMVTTEDFNARRYSLMNGRSQFLYYKKVYGKRYPSKYYWLKKISITTRRNKISNYKEKLEILKDEYKTWKLSENRNKLS